MRAHCLQHVAVEGPAYIAEWLAAGGHELTVTRLFEGEPLPEPSAVDLLVVMGGPMGANDDATVPWLVAEVAFIRDVIEAGTPVLGVCLGAQLVARALGAAVHPNPEPEIGWFPVRSAALASDDVFSFPAELTVFHWHGDTFELPARRGAACEQRRLRESGVPVRRPGDRAAVPPRGHAGGRCGHDVPVRRAPSAGARTCRPRTRSWRPRAWATRSATR